jgi:hypothetical protein
MPLRLTHKRKKVPQVENGQALRPYFPHSLDLPPIRIPAYEIRFSLRGLATTGGGSIYN